MNGIGGLAYTPPKYRIFDVGITATTMEEVVSLILSEARKRTSLGVSALAVHGLMEAARNADVGAAVERLNIVVPDGQPVRWALRFLHGIALPDRVSGPDLMANLCVGAAREGIGIYLYGSTPETCRDLVAELSARHPTLKIVGVQSDRFRDATPEEDADDIRRINASGAGIVFVGRGCPRQEKWVATHVGKVDAVMVAVGAAFDFLSGRQTRAPRFMQTWGLEWTWRLAQEPRRLWRRYLLTNSLYAAYLLRALLFTHSGRRRER